MDDSVFVSMIKSWFCGVGDPGTGNAHPFSCFVLTMDFIWFDHEHMPHLKTKCVLHKAALC